MIIVFWKLSSKMTPFDPRWIIDGTLFLFCRCFLIVALVGLTANSLVSSGEAPPEIGHLQMISAENEAEIPTQYEQLVLLFHCEPGVQFTGYLVAQNEGYFQEEGLPPVDIRGYRPTARGDIEMLAGRAQFCTIMLSRAYYVRVKEKDRCVAISQIAQQATSGIMIRGDLHPDIHALSDFSGYRLGIFFRGRESVLAAAKTLNLNIKPVDYMNDGLALLRRGVVDGVCYSSYGSLVYTHYSKYTDIIRVFPLSETGCEMPEDALICTKKFMYAHPEICQKFVRALWRGWKKAKDDRKLSLNVLKAYYDREGYFFDEHITSEQLDLWFDVLELQPVLEDNGILSRDQFAHMVQLYIDTDMLPTDDVVSYDDYFYPVMRPETMERIKAENEAESKKAEDAASPESDHGGAP